MAQILLGGKSALNTGTDLDPMFTELYGLLNLFTIAGSNLGLGGAPSGDKFAVAGAGSANIISTRSTDASGVRIAMQAAGSTAGYAGTFSNHPFILVSNGVERMRVDTSGNMGIGGSPTYAVDVVKADAAIRIAPSTTTNSALVRFTNNGNGFVGHDSSTGSLTGVAYAMTVYRSGAFPLVLATNDANRLVIESTGHVSAGADNTQTFGTASKRWSTFYAGSGTINTSDAREKTAVRPLDDSELRAAKDLAKEIGAYRFLEAVATKGDAAREHIGMTVQRAIEVMQRYGLDPMGYGFICYDEWDEVQTPARVETRTEDTGLLDELGAPLVRTFEVEVEPAKVIPAGNRYSFRPDELLMFIARGFEARLAALEAA